MISESTLLVRPEHLNHHGYLFGGRLLEWLDEQAYIAAITRLMPEANLVTVGIDRVEFKFSVVQGSLLLFRSQVVHAGRTSMTVFTQVFRRLGPDEDMIFSAYVSFVCLNAAGKPALLAPYFLKPFDRDKLKSAELKKHWDAIEKSRSARKRK